MDAIENERVNINRRYKFIRTKPPYIYDLRYNTQKQLGGMVRRRVRNGCVENTTDDVSHRAC